MSKQRFNRATAHVRVQAVPLRVIKNSKGETIQEFYDIYGPAWMKRTN